MFCQTQYRFIGITVTEVPEKIALLLQRLNGYGMGVSQGINRDATSKVYILITGLIPEMGTFSSYGNKFCWRISGNHQAVEITALNIRLVHDEPQYSVLFQAQETL
ncbi:hypothetical protein KPLM21_1090080 [Klebsiella pneumoniae]|nr:hypothetical protein NUKP79_49700 [Klebsiella quasipneumoniae]CED73217.1 hypothetical protein KPLM21_1090080 [Klebsiella pneumoniae]